MMFLSFRISARKFKKTVLDNYWCTVRCRNIQTLGLDDIPNISATEIRKLLRQKGFAVQDGNTSLSIKCAICSGEQKADEGKLYVNKATGERDNNILICYVTL